MAIPIFKKGRMAKTSPPIAAQNNMGVTCPSTSGGNRRYKDSPRSHKNRGQQEFHGGELTPSGRPFFFADKGEMAGGISVKRN
jgi:hypothetical protein